MNARAKAKLERANKIHAHEQQVIATMRDQGAVVVHGLHGVCVWCRDGDAEGKIPHHDCPNGNGTERPLNAHELARIEDLPGGKARFVCACGDVGIAVGCSVFPGVEWATIAHGYHAAQNYDQEGNHVER